MYDELKGRSTAIGTRKWIAYEPQKIESEVVAVGSNIRFFQYGQLDLWVGTAASANASCNIREGHSECGMMNIPSHNALMWAMNTESQLCRNSSAADLLIIDGSIRSRMAKIQDAFSKPKYCLEFLKILYRGENTVFVSVMAPLGILSDEYGINRIRQCAIANRQSGFGHVCKDDLYGPDLVISTVYARLEDWTMMLKIEMFGSGHDDMKIKSILDHLHTGDLTGNPTPIRNVQNMCMIDDSSISHITRLCQKSLSKWTVT